MKSFGCDFFWPWVGGVPWGEGAREECWCDYDCSVYHKYCLYYYHIDIIQYIHNEYDIRTMYNV